MEKAVLYYSSNFQCENGGGNLERDFSSARAFEIFNVVCVIARIVCCYYHKN